MLSLAALLAAPAFAICVDHEPDGAGPGCAVDLDCKPWDASVHAHAPEDGIDEVDNDCDNTVLVRRLYVSAMEVKVGDDWTLTANASPNALRGEVEFQPASGTASMTFKTSLPFASGRLTVNTRFSAMSSATCELVVASTSMASATFPLLAGTNQTAVAGVLPGDTIGTLKVRCSGGPGSFASLDWLTVQNGPYVWAPLNDVSASFETMGLPGVGRQAVVRTSEDGTYSFVGSDVGGLGWSADGFDWNAANGRWNEFSDFSEGGVWEVYSDDSDVPESQEVFILTGHKDSGDLGGLYYTANLGASAQTWTAAPGGLGASKHIDDCVDASGDKQFEGKPISSGHLIVQHPSDPNLLFVASSDPDTRGIWQWDRSTPSTAPTQPFSTLELPTPDNPDTPNYTALPSALAIADRNGSEAGGEILLIGYKLLAEDDLLEHGALYACDIDAASCWRVYDTTDRVTTAYDVRDIEVDPAPLAGTVGFFVADGGRSWLEGDGITPGTCELGESTVLYVAITNAATMEVWDTDRTDAAHPSWNRTSTSPTALPYFAADACFDNNATGAPTYGELVPPRGIRSNGDAPDGHEISTIAVDPEGEYLFAFYPLGDGPREYGCARAFRTEVGAVALGSTPWTPLSGYENGQMAFYVAGGHASIRRNAVVTNGGFMESEPLVENFAGTAVHDAAFEWAGDPLFAEYDLLAGGNFLWRLPNASNTTTGVGWDTARPANTYSYTLDYAEWELAWAEGPAFQDGIGKALALCPGCLSTLATVGDFGIAAGLGDYKTMRLYAEGPSGRQPADRACEFHKLNGSGSDVDVWTDPTGASAPQGWMIVNTQNSKLEDDAGLARGVFYLADARTDAWCWDGMGDTKLAPDNYLDDFYGTAGNWELYCHDSALVYSGVYFESCYQGGAAGDPWNVAEAGIGVMRSVRAIGAVQAVVAASPGKQTDGTTDGEGLWVLTYHATNGILYTEVGGFPTGGLDTDGNGVGDCTKDELFAFSGRNKVVVDPIEDASGRRRVFVTSRHRDVVSTNGDCGIVQAWFDPADPAASTASDWEAVPLQTASGSCTLTSKWLEGAAVSRDGRWLMAFGGGVEGGTTVTPANGGGVCAVDLWSATAPSGWTREEAAPSATIGIDPWTLLPHPHLDDTFYYGGIGDPNCSSGCKAPGIYALQRRWSPSTGSWRWGFVRFHGDDLEYRSVVDLDWGVGWNEAGSPMSRLYVTTAGGSYWDGEVAPE